jgi:hypothetical protein
MNKPPYIAIGNDVYRLCIFRVESFREDGRIDVLRAVAGDDVVELSPTGDKFIIAYIHVAEESPLLHVPLPPFSRN